MESLHGFRTAHRDDEPLRLTEARSGARVCDPQHLRFMGRDGVKGDSRRFEGKSILKDSKLQAMIVERHGSGLYCGFDEHALHERIQEHGFIPSHHEPSGRRPFQVAGSAQGNILCTRNPSAANERLRDAPSFILDHLSV